MATVFTRCVVKICGIMVVIALPLGLLGMMVVMVLPGYVKRLLQISVASRTPTLNVTFQVDYALHPDELLMLENTSANASAAAVEGVTWSL